MTVRIAGLLGAIFLAFAIGASAFASEGVQERKDRLQHEVAGEMTQAVQAMKDKNFDLAIQLYGKILDANAMQGEDLGTLYFARGSAYQAKKDCVSALADYGHAVETLTKNADLYFNRSLCESELKQPDKALADLDAAVKVNPESTMYRQARCVALFNKKDFAGALPDCEIVLRSSPDDKNMLLAVSQAAERLGDKAKAAAAYKHLLELDPGNATATAGLRRVGG